MTGVPEKGIFRSVTKLFPVNAISLLKENKCRIYRIKGILFSILSLSGPWSGEPDRVSQMIVLIKTVSNTNSPLFCLSVIYIQKSLKLFFFGTTFFLAYFSLRSVIHSNRAHYIFSWTMNVTSQGVIFTVPQICA